MATKINELVENTAIKQDSGQKKLKLPIVTMQKNHFLFTVSDKTPVFLKVNRDII